MNILGQARFRLIDRLRGTTIVSTLKRLRKEQFLNPAALVTISNKNRVQLIEHALMSTPYYRNINKDVHSSVLTKDIIRKNPESFFSNTYVGKKIRKGTGGSTGAPLVYYTTNEAQSFMWAGIILSWETLGYKLGEKVAFVAGTSLAKNDLQHTVFYRLLNVTVYSAYHLNDSDIKTYLIQIKKTRARLIYGYATAVNSLAEYILKNGPIQFPDLRGIVTTAEILSDKHRDNISQAFNVKVHNQYGCNEAGISAFECDFGNMHYINTATSLALDSEGNVLATNLVNKAYPMIRYFTGDKFSLLEGESCPCKRGYPIMGSFMGRTCDMVIDQRNKVMHSAFFNILFRDDKHIEQFQVQFNKNEIVVLLEVDDQTLPEEYFMHYLDIVKKNMQFDHYDLKINYPFLPAENAKHRYVINTSNEAITL